MADIKFNCQHCQRSLKAPEEKLRGQQINCPTCKGTIQVPDCRTLQQEPVTTVPPKAMQDCPFCGEEILLSAIKCKHCGEFLDDRTKQSKSANSKKSESSNEETIYVGKPSWWNYFLLFFVAGILLVGAVVNPISLFIAIFLIVLAFLDRLGKLFTLTNKRVLCKKGIFSREMHEVGTKDIRNINVKQGILGRMFGYGTVEIASAGTDGVEVSFVGISDPIRVRDLIRKEKDNADN